MIRHTDITNEYLERNFTITLRQLFLVDIDRQRLIKGDGQDLEPGLIKASENFGFLRYIANKKTLSLC